MKRISRLLLRGTMWRTVSEFAGFGCLVYAAWLVQPIAGIVAAGAVLLLYGNLRSR